MAVAAVPETSVPPCVAGSAPICKHERGWRRIVRNFTPAWFSVNMGTGITSILLNTLPYNGKWLYFISLAIFALNVVYFLVFCGIVLVRYIVYPEIFGVMVRHPAQSLFLGTFPMGLATIINMFCFVCVPKWGDAAAYFAWGLWIFDAVVSIVVALAIPFIVMTRQSHMGLDSMTAAWLLPVVAPIVAAASGGIVAEVLPSVQHALWTIILSYILWGVGVPFAMMIAAIYLQRLMLHKLPPNGVIVSVFLPLGPLGQGGFGIQKLGQVAKSVFPKTGSIDPLAGDIMYILGFFVALVMWAFGLVWLIFAIATLGRSRRFPFNLGWWGLTFPLGVYATCTCQLGRELPSATFSVIGTVFSICVVLLWLCVSFCTTKAVYRGNIFVAPCLQDLPPKEDA